MNKKFNPYDLNDISKVIYSDHEYLENIESKFNNLKFFNDLLVEKSLKIAELFKKQYPYENYPKELLEFYTFMGMSLGGKQQKTDFMRLA